MEKECKQRDSDIIRVVLYGPESTGKTTLSKQLASYYHTNWVPEYMRTFLENKAFIPGEEIVSYEELDSIAKGQMKVENASLNTADTLLFCDTNLLELQVYAEHYFGESPEAISKYALKNKYDLYILTYVDVPWEADGMRDRPEDREKMFAMFEQKLIENNLPYITVKGNEQERLEFAVSYIDKLLLTLTV